MSDLKVIIYPVTEEMRAFIEFAELNENIEILACCVPENSYECDKSFYLEDGREIKLIDINKYLLTQSFDVIIVPNTGDEFDFDIFIKPYTEEIAACHKRMIFINELENIQKTYLNERSISFEVLRLEKIQISKLESRLIQIRTPVVFVLGMYENTDKLSTLLYLHNYIRQNGYKVKTILTKENLLNFPDCYSFPHEMFEKKYTDAEKIVFFNHYVREIELLNKSDVIVIGIPGEIMPLNQKHNGNYGVMPFLISNAVKCDYAVLNVFSNFSTKEFTEQMMEVCKNKYLIEINDVVISKMVLDISSLNSDKLKIYYFNELNIESDDHLFYERKNKNNISLGENLLNVLSAYGNYSKI